MARANEGTTTDIQRPASLPAVGTIPPFDAGWEAHAVGLDRQTVAAIFPDPAWALLGWDSRALLVSRAPE